MRPVTRRLTRMPSTSFLLPYVFRLLFLLWSVLLVRAQRRVDPGSCNTAWTNSIRSSAESKRLDCPELRCSTRPQNVRGSTPVSRVNCTTKAFHAGRAGTLLRRLLRSGWALPGLLEFATEPVYDFVCMEIPYV